MRGQFALGHARNTILSSATCDSSVLQAAPLPKDTAESEIKTSIFPNPFASQITINSNNATDLMGKKIKLYDVTGKIYLTETLQSQRTTIPLYKMPAGVYFLKIVGLSKPSVFKVVKQTNY